MRSESDSNGPCLLLVSISTLMLQLALCDRQGVFATEWIHLGIAAIFASVIYVATKWYGDKKSTRWLVTTCFLLLAVLPFAYNSFLRAARIYGYLFDIQVALVLRNAMLGLAANHNAKRGHRFAVLASCFTVLFSSLWLMDRLMIALLFVYTIVGMWWLMGSYWERICDCFLSSSERYIPWKPLGAASGVGMLGLFILLPLTTGISFTAAIDGFMPSSGGTRWQDEFAIGGVGDGPQMVRAKDNASTFGPIESELFLESKMPSLYDVFNEFYGEPPKPSRKRAIPLSPSFMQQNHKRLGVNKQSSREFNTTGRRKTETKKANGSKSPALLQVAGRVPAHLALYYYDMWDGRNLSSSEDSLEKTFFLDKSGNDGRAWARYPGEAENELLPYRDRHELRIINLKTDRVPAPPNFIGIHIDELHTETLFTTTMDGMPAMDMDFIPQLSVLHVESLRRTSLASPNLVTSESTTNAETNRIHALAEAWTAGLETDWEKVEAICNRLREHYTLDFEHETSPETEDAVDYFLFESKRGPDHHFAVSAALLMRSLGYESRIVSGLYADAHNYERDSRVTPVYAENAHFWVEVLAKAPETKLSANRVYWLPLEPTPGYQLLLAPESFWAVLMNHTAQTFLALKRNPITTLACLAILIASYMKRAAIGDLIVTAWWEINHRLGDDRHCVISTLRLLNRRAYVRGNAVAKGEPLKSWACVKKELSDQRPEGNKTSFYDLANWALYGEGTSLDHPTNEVNSICRQAASVGFRPDSQNNTNTNTLSDK